MGWDNHIRAVTARLLPQHLQRWNHSEGFQIDARTSSSDARVRSTTIQEINGILGLSVPPNVPYWTYGVIRTARGPQLVRPGDWIVTWSNGRIDIYTHEEATALWPQGLNVAPLPPAEARLDYLLPTRTANQLARNGIYSLGQLLQLSDYNIRELHGIGQKGMTEIKDLFRNNGIYR